MYRKFRKSSAAPAAKPYVKRMAALAVGLSLLTVPLTTSAYAHNLKLLAVPYTAAQTASHEDQTFRIVALGDSLTVGYEFGMENQPNPIPYGYVERVYEQALFQGYRTEIANYGILGLKTGGLERLMAAAAMSKPLSGAEVQTGLFDPRADKIAAGAAEIKEQLQLADLAVLTIGSNDFSPMIDLIKAGATREETDAWIDSMLSEFDLSFSAALSSILSINPKVQIVAADLYSPLPNNKLLGIQESDYLYVQSVSAKFRAKLNEVSGRFSTEGYRVKPAYVGESFINNETKYTTIVASKGKDIHPTQSGYTAMGDAFAKAVWGEVRQTSPRTADQPISVVVSGKEVITPFKPIIKNGRSYLVLRDIADAMGAETSWNASSKTAIIKLGSRQVALTIGSDSMLVDGKPVTIDSPPFLQRSGKEQKTYVPLAVLADGLGYQVVYRAPIKTAFINS
ncbi:stalk domain-containing protein [Paenibacillus tarimensis]|uniref:stalk domain-containing protein n=1 Tax=Paenibacillus tarimensis TaxID=416012 RepID=UPI001EEC06A1|nr:stalk domain-containing protein [Paenibacillus tarimensis]MCF2944982.1 GDSL-type esterase/lipase family protein [Paenibacillus tarimensis]